MSLEIGDALIAMSFLNLIGIIIILEFRNRFWFKKENWKLQKSNISAMNTLKLDRMRKELQLPKSGKTKIPGDTGGLSETIVKGIGKALTGGEEGEGAIGGFLGDWLEEHPEVINQFLKGLSQGKGENNDQFGGLFNA